MGISAGGLSSKLIAHDRLFPLQTAAFPMRASTRGFSPVLRASSQGVISSRKALS